MSGQTAPVLVPRATVGDLYRTDGQAELIGGRILRFPAFGYKPGCIVGAIVSSLYDLAHKTGQGEVGTATLGYIIPELPSGRESFCADASYYVGPLPTNPMHFIEGPPTFAVEVRSGDDYTLTAESEIAAKRARLLCCRYSRRLGRGRDCRYHRLLPRRCADQAGYVQSRSNGGSRTGRPRLANTR